MAEENNEQNVLAKVIIEMLGAPKEHIEKTLKDYVEKLKDDKDIEIAKEEFAPAEEQNKLFSTFAELEIRFKNAQKLVDFCFDSMPSSVEIIEPESITINSAGLTETLNDIQAKLHNSDMVIKTLRAKNTILDKNAKKILRNFVSYMIEGKEKTIEELSSKMGISAQHLKPFLEELVKEGKIKEKEGRYGGIK
jgi:predicted transcriptional regulator